MSRATTPTEAYRQAERLIGSCPIEAGLIGDLADNECSHGRLPGDTTRRCGCWREEGAVLKVVQGTQLRLLDARLIA